MAVLGSLALIALCLALLPGVAGAAKIHAPEATFELAAGGTPGGVAVDEETGDVYVLRRSSPGQNDIERFDAEGNPLNFPGSPGRNERQTVHFEGSWATGNKFTLTCPNGETTGEITWISSAEEIQSNIRAGLEAKCGGSYSLESGPYNPIVEFRGAFAETNVPRMICTKTAGSGTCEIQNEINGASELNLIETHCGSSCFDIAIDNSGGPNQGVIYVSTSTSNGNTVNGLNPEGGVQVYLPSGVYVGTIHTRSQDNELFVQSCGVAVDDSGNLIVAHGAGEARFSYFDKLEMPNWETSPNLNPPILGTIDSDFGNGCRTDVDSEGNLYVNQGSEWYSSGPLRKYPADAFEVDPNPEGGPIAEPSKVPSQLLGSGSYVDVTADDEGNVITFNTNGEFLKLSTENGSPIEAFYDPSVFIPVGVTLNKSAGKVYATDRGFQAATKDVHIYKSSTVPDSRTGAFEPVTATKGILSGEVDPAGGGEITGCEFEVVGDAKFAATKFAEATTVPCEPEPSTEPAEVSAEVEGLTLEELQHFRLRTENVNGVSLGSIHVFTPHAVIRIATQPATDIAPRSVTLNGSYEGNGEATEYYFEWGTNQSYGNTTPVHSAGSPTGATDVSDALEGLELETNYHYRVVMSNAVGTSKGEDRSFTTRPAVTGLVTKPASSLDLETITLNAEFQGDGLETHYHFQYGLTSQYEFETPEESVEATSGPTQLSTEIEKFNGYRTYHYRVVAENSFGKTVGQDETFVAPNPEVPAIENTRVKALTPTAVTISTDINPNHWATIYLFEWGETINYGTATPFSEPFGGLDNEPVEIAEEITGLTPGSIYHIRSVAVNFRGTMEGEDVMFITPDAPSVDSTFSTAVGRTQAHLGGLVAARASATRVSFQYGTSTAYGASTPAMAIGEELTSREVGAEVGDLAPGTTYHFRIAATNAWGTTYGPDQTFTTEAEPTKAIAPPDCNTLARRAKGFADEAKRLKEEAKHAVGKRASALRRRAESSAKRARRLSKKASECRAGSGGVSK